MSWFEAVILGIVQGLTEFLPVSSSGHLELTKALVGDNSLPEESLMMTVVLHAATALSTMVIFRKDIAEIVTGLLRFRNNEEFRFSVKIVLSMVPAALVGVLFEDHIEQFFGGQILLVGCMLLITAALLFLADKARNTLNPVSYKNAFIIGIAQAIAILPGISRSGATISTSVMLGVDRQKAARFSFLMVVPLILGKMAKDIISGDLGASETNTSLLMIGFVAAFVSGLVACQWMIALVKRSQLKYFSYYCVLVGLVAIVYSLI